MLSAAGFALDTNSHDWIDHRAGFRCGDRRGAVVEIGNRKRIEEAGSGKDECEPVP